MKKILCPTDFSESAQNAIAYAAKLAQKIGAQLTLFNVQSLLELTALELVRGKALRVEAYKELLEKQSFEISKTFKISCYAEVQPSSSSFAKTIANRAIGYDLIIMGTNGADSFFQFLSGSNAYQAVIKTNVPVLIIPSGCMYSEIQNVVYAFDFLRERKLPIQQLLPLIDALKAQLTVLQVMEEAYSKDTEDYLKELQFILQQNYGDQLTLRFDSIRSSKVSTSIDRYIAEHQPDALAVCTVHRNFLETLFHKSVIKNISSISEYPVFVFHG